MLDELWQSLRAAGDHLSEDRVIVLQEEDKFDVRCRLQLKPSPAAKKAMFRYIRSIARAEGWVMQNLQIKGFYLELAASRAASSFSSSSSGNDEGGPNPLKP